MIWIKCLNLLLELMIPSKKKIMAKYVLSFYKYTNFSFYYLKNFPSTFNLYKIFKRCFWSIFLSQILYFLMKLWV